MNSTIGSNINGSLSAEKVSFNQKIANGSRSSLLLGNIDFTLTEIKKPTSVSTVPGQFLCKVTNNEVLFNGQKKHKNCVDQNRNTFNNSYVTVNGNKEKVVEDGIPVPKIQLYTGKIYVEWKQNHKIGAGLNNLGNTCFMNTVIQCLTYCPPLANYLLHDNDHASKCSITGFCMMCVLQKHMKRAIGKTGDIIKPLDVYQRLKLIAKHFQYGRQEDAHEFLRYVIDNLWKSCLSQNNNISKLDPASKETTVINQIFGGYHRSQVTCLRCKEKSNTFDHFMDFILDIKQNVLTLEKALEKFTQPELLEQENSYKCPKCKMKVTAHKRFTVYKAPNVATFQLKRFDYNRSFGGKITKQITYPEKLNLRPYMSESKGDPVWYRLNAVLVHSGPSCNSGHYYCYVKNADGCWYVMDDQRVHMVGLGMVLNQSAYVLFYIKAESSQAPSFKKCFENRNTIMKGNTPSCNYKKNSELSSLKPSPLTERIQAKQSSPTIKHQLCSPVNNKKLSMSPNQSRERISFGIQPSMPIIQDIRKPLDIVSTSPKKVKHSLNISKANNNHTGLVPYMKDSSESSDDNESGRNGSSKPESSQGSYVGFPDSIKLNGAKINIKLNRNVNNNSPKIDIRRKVSRPAHNPSRFSPTVSNNASSLSSKVIATSSWTVTDAAAVSPSAASSSSSNSVNSTTDWHVTSTNAEASAETVVNNVASERNGQNSETALSKNSGPLSSREVYSSPDQDTRTTSFANGQEPKSSTTSIPNDYNGAMCSNSSPGKKCDFRKQPQSQSEKTFLDDEKKSIRNQHNSFLKRKCSESDKEISEIYPKLYHDEGRHNSLPKKAKYTKEYAESPSKNGVTVQKSTNEKYDNVTEMKHSASHSKSFQCSNPNSKAGSQICDIKSYKPEKSKDKKKLRDDENASISGGSHSSLEYVWVEKTKDSIENSQPSSIKDKYDKGTHYSGSSSHSKIDRKYDVVSELNKNCEFFYASSVPTWKGENHYYDSKSINEKRKSLDDYEDEFDRGKTRKFKSKDRYHHYYRQNPFQKHSEKNYNNHSKYNGNSHYGHHNHHHKPYDSNYKWKQNRSYDHQRNRKYFRSHFQR